MNKKIIIGSDHAGFILKNKLAAYLQQAGFDVDDAGTYTTESCDYPIIAKEVAQNIKEGKYEKGIRAAVVSDTCSAKMSRLHNDANILCLGERIVGEELAKDIAEIWLKTPFLGERHSRRVEMFEQD